MPLALQADAAVPGQPAGIRYFPRDARHVAAFVQDYLESLEKERKALADRGQTGPLPPSNFLAISGGGDNGAFGAGLMKGWSASGSRPEFKLVTGVSTGALIAPFAFLGPAYDDTLKSLYTEISMKDVAIERWMLSGIYHEAMADNTPLRQLVEKSIDRRVIEAIAAEDAKGRILLVGTTNLDLRRPVIWNITKIARAGAPGSLELVQKILIASAAIPGTFPPVMIEVEAGGKRYEEMHVDGGATAQVFVYPAAIKLNEVAERERTLYIIRNARLDPEWSQVDRRTLSIALRAITSLIQSQGMGDLYRIYTVTQRDHVAYRLAYIPPTFQTPHLSDFDPAYMKPLYRLGYDMAAKGYPWEDRPPVLVSGVDDMAARNLPAH
ncbi:MAG TPA: patatin-like phospholipase family protein [Candidatus Polarisedimenticolia bacterium]|nr:patatin-like phospholipase family protein [Candidatus Polarisedimenticolia bacterium]